MSKTTGGFKVLETKLFGAWSRYKLSKCIGRYGDEVYFVTDAETLDDLGLPKVIRQTATREEAMKGLE